jgi:predicted DNA-binding protein YlxM (UPF0122 family)
MENKKKLSIEEEIAYWKSIEARGLTEQARGAWAQKGAKLIKYTDGYEDVFKRDRKHIWHIDWLEDVAEPETGNSGSRQRRHQIMGILQELAKKHLSSKDFEVFSLLYEKGLTIKEIAQKYGVSRSRANFLKTRADSRLKALYSTYSKKLRLEDRL